MPIVRFALLFAMLALGGASGAAKPADGPRDPLGLDPGEAKDEEAFMAWVKDPRGGAPVHPLSKLDIVVQKDPRNWADYLTFVCNQAGIKGAGKKALKALAETIYLRAPYVNAAPASRDEQKKDATYMERETKQGREFFKTVPRAARVRVYIVAEKFEVARLAMLDLVRTSQGEITDAWIDSERADEARKEAGYFYGLCNDAPPARVRAVTEDFKLTIKFMLTFAGPPGYVHGKVARDKVRAQKRAARAKLLQGLEPITF